VSSASKVEREIFIDHEKSGEESSGNSSLSDENEEVEFTTESLATVEDKTETDLETLYTLEEIEAECESEKDEGSFEAITTTFEENSASGTRNNSKEWKCDDEDFC
jgi:hypothetical protein